MIFDYSVNLPAPSHVKYDLLKLKNLKNFLTKTIPKIKLKVFDQESYCGLVILSNDE